MGKQRPFQYPKTCNRLKAKSRRSGFCLHQPILPSLPAAMRPVLGV
jgi:hypothetical protein